MFRRWKKLSSNRNKEKTIRKYEVFEDNGGGLHLAIFSENGKNVVFFHSDYEYNHGQLQEDLEAIADGAAPENEWDGNCGGSEWEYGTDPQTLYNEISSSEWADLIADNDGIYPNKMSGNARYEFGISDEENF